MELQRKWKRIDLISTRGWTRRLLVGDGWGIVRRDVVQVRTGQALGFIPGERNGGVSVT